MRQRDSNSQNYCPSLSIKQRVRKFEPVADLLLKMIFNMAVGTGWLSNPSPETKRLLDSAAGNDY